MAGQLRSRHLRMIGAISIPLLLAFGCSRAELERRAFQRAERAGVEEAYERFIEMYPDSPRVQEARERMVELREQALMKAFESAKKAKKASILERFIVDHRHHPRLVTLAKLRIAEIDFDDLRKDNPFRPTRLGNQTWSGFVTFYAFGKFLPVPEDPELRETYYEQLHPLIVHALGQVQSFDLWMAYLKRYPESPMFQEAAEQVEQYLLARSDKWETFDLLNTYLALYDEVLNRPCPQREQLVANFHEGLAKAVVQSDSVEEYDRYLEAFPDSPLRVKVLHAKLHKQLTIYMLQSDREKIKGLIDDLAQIDLPEAREDIRQARKRIEELDYKEALAERTPQALKSFIQRYEGQDLAELIPLAQTQLEAIRDQMFARAKRVNESQLYHQFLLAFPNAPQVEEAKKLLQTALFEEAIRGTNPDIIRQLLKRYPDSERREAAEKRIEELEYQAAAARATSEPTTKTLALFIERYPKSNYVEEARELFDQIQRQHREYVAKREQARRERKPRVFSEWIVEVQKDNYYAAIRGVEDLEALRRWVVVQQIADAVMTTPTAAARRSEGAVARTVREYARMIAYIETDTGSSTGFLFTDNGLILTNARIIRQAKRDEITATIGGRKSPVDLVAMGATLDVAVLRAEGSFDTIPFGNSAALTQNDRLRCLAAHQSGIERFEGTFYGTRKTGDGEYLVIQFPENAPTHYGGIVLNRRAEAVGFLVQPEHVPAAIKEAAEDCCFALSLRSVLPIMRETIQGE